MATFPRAGALALLVVLTVAIALVGCDGGSEPSPTSQTASSPQTSGAPGLIYEVGAGNYEAIIQSLETDWVSEISEPRLPGAIGAQMAVICGEEAPYVTAEEMAGMLAIYPPGESLLSAVGEQFYRACQQWGLGPADPLENAPVSSDIPTLILVGEYDAAIQPHVARHTAERLSNSALVEFPGAGHSVVLLDGRFAGSARIRE